MNAAPMVARCERHQIADSASRVLTTQQEREVTGTGDAPCPAQQQILADPEHLVLSCEDVPDMAWD